MSGWIPSGAGCLLDMRAVWSPAAPLTVAVDAGGVINDNTAKISGSIASNGSGQFTKPSVYPPGDATCTPTYVITSASKDANGKWVLSGTWAFGGQTFSFTVTQQ